MKQVGSRTTVDSTRRTLSEPVFATNAFLGNMGASLGVGEGDAEEDVYGEGVELDVVSSGGDATA